MSGDQEAALEPLPQKRAGAADLLDDVGDGDHRNEVVAHDRHREAVLIEAARHVAVERRIHARANSRHG